VSDVIYI